MFRKFSFLTGRHLRNLNIDIVPYDEPYWKCGSTSNDIATGETVSFTCDPNAIGTALKITIEKRFDSLLLCEVLVFGTGMLS